MDNATKERYSSVSKGKPPLRDDGSTQQLTTSGASTWEPPDGGYGWVIVALSFALYTLFAIYPQLGVFLLALEDYFGVSKSTASWLNAVQAFMSRLLGAMIGPLLHHVGGRWLVGGGTLFSAAGFFISSYVNSFPVMFLTYGLLPSIGTGCFIVTSTTIVQQYFKTKRSLAIGMAATGINAGILIWPPLASHLINKYSLQMAFRVESAIFLVTGLLITVLLRPPGNQHTWVPCRRKVSDENPAQENDDMSQEGQPKKNGKHCCQISCSSLDFTLLKDAAFVQFFIGIIFGATGVLQNNIFLQVRGEMLGFDSTTSSLQSVILGIASGISTPVFSGVGNIKGVKRSLMVGIGFCLSGITVLLSTLLTTSTQLFVYAGIMGATMGLHVGNSMTLIGDVAGLDRLAVGAGFNGVGWGLAHLFLHPTAGWLLDETLDPQAPFYLGGTCFCIGGVVIALLPLTQQRMSRRRMRHDLSLATPTDVSSIRSISDSFVNNYAMDYSSDPEIHLSSGDTIIYPL